MLQIRKIRGKNLVDIFGSMVEKLGIYGCFQFSHGIFLYIVSYERLLIESVSD
jgi:hypothetical protein